MPYKFVSVSADVEPMHFADMKAFRAAIAPLKIVIKGTAVTDADGNPYGKLTYVKKAPEATIDRAPKMVQPNPDGPSLDQILADIDLLEVMDGDGSDFTDDDVDAVDAIVEVHPAVDVVPTPKRRKGAAERAGIPLEGVDEGQQGSPYDLPPLPVTRVSVRHPRMSHKNCGHATTGEAGKIARAECRARHRDGQAVAS